MIPPIPELEDYGLDLETGFMPAEPPLERLEDGYYAPWERIMDKFHGLLLAGRLREAVLKLPVLSTIYLETVEEKRRAYVVLSFLAHGYVWNGSTPVDRLPAALSIPWDAVSLALEIRPVLTLSAVSLWNYTTLFPVEKGEMLTLDNLATLQTFTGTPSESWFYLISAAIEARSTIILPLLLSSLHAVRSHDVSLLTSHLRSLAIEIVEMGVLLQKMHSDCDPAIFYNSIRPYLAGWNNMTTAGLPHGVIYEGTKRFHANPPHPIDWSTGYRTYAGGSNAQSALIQALDIVMGIDHRPTGEGKDTGGQGIPPPKKHEFIREMRGYMPGPHRRFLEDLSRVSDVREFISGYPAGIMGDELREAYDACLAGLRRFRDIHIQIVSRYILLPSAKTTVKKANPGGETGTGGTQLIPFLKQVREETVEGVAAEYTRGLIAQGLFPRESAKRSREVAEKGQMQTVGLAGVWETGFDGVGGICHW